MATNWTQPENNTLYTEVLGYIEERNTLAATQFNNITDWTNIPTGAVRFDRSASTWKTYNGTAWDLLVASGTDFVMSASLLGGKNKAWYTNASNIAEGTISNSYLPTSIGGSATNFTGASFSGILKGSVKNSHATPVTVLSTGTNSTGTDATFTGNAATATLASKASSVVNANSTPVTVLSTGTNSTGTDATFTGNAATANKVNISIGPDTDSDYSVLYSSTTTGNMSPLSNSSITFNPSTGTLSASVLKSSTLESTTTINLNGLGSVPGILSIYNNSANDVQEVGPSINLKGAAVVAGGLHGDCIIKNVNGDMHLNSTQDTSIYSGTGLNNTIECLRVSGYKLHVRGKVIAYSDTLSDRNLKTAISTVENALTKVSQLNGVEFTRKDSGNRSAGVIAQDVEKVLPQAVSETTLPLQTGKEDTLFKTVEYDALHSLYIEAIKELKAIVEKQAVQIKDLQGA
jgi:hypothetical protein